MRVGLIDIMNAFVILNEASGTSAPADRGRPTAITVGEELAAAGVTAKIETVAPQDFVRAMQRAIAARPQTVIAGGGDGTIRSAAELLVDTEIRLGVLPLGTLNHFAKDL